jgi:hypothetical protein
MKGGGASFAIEGTWTIDERDRICETARVGDIVLAPRCVRFKQSDKYFSPIPTRIACARYLRTVKKIWR